MCSTLQLRNGNRLRRASVCICIPELNECRLFVNSLALTHLFFIIARRSTRDLLLCPRCTYLRRSVTGLAPLLLHKASNFCSEEAPIWTLSYGAIMMSVSCMSVLALFLMEAIGKFGSSRQAKCACNKYNHHSSPCSSFRVQTARHCFGSYEF